MFKAHYTILDLQFKFPAGTSRGVLLHKPSTFILLEEDGYTGIGECSTIPDLSIDPVDTYSNKLNEICRLLNEGIDPDSIDLKDYPSIAFGLETALLDIAAKGTKCLFPSSFTQGTTGIPINGLVWMGDKAFMQKQIREKIEAGYHCIKLKIGANEFNTELEIIAAIRREFTASDLEIRLDANGAFNTKEALDKLNKLSAFSVHSIEQPIRQQQFEAMAELCSKSPIPIVLDEELIGVGSAEKEALLVNLKPSYIILKPSLIGGLQQSEEWIKLAQKHAIGWWVTSALEANIGLNAIAQWTSTLGSNLPQGLGTGQLYHNNIPSPLVIENASLFYRPENNWDLHTILI